ncbi:MAG: 50S ribosomal protein L25 [Chloroflexota bacterium]
MSQIELKLTDRDILGKKVSELRRQGITPAHLYGHGIESVALQCDTNKLKRVLVQAGRTALITLAVNDEGEPRTAVVREVQIEPVTGTLLHVDFYQVRMAEKLKMEVPVVLIGEAPILKSEMVVQELNNLTVECLPADIPARLEVDISSLTVEGQVIRVKDITLEKDITILNDAELMVARVIARPIEKIEEKEVTKVVAEEGAETPEAAVPQEETAKE